MILCKDENAKFVQTVQETEFKNKIARKSIENVHTYTEIILSETSEPLRKVFILWQATADFDKENSIARQRGEFS